MPLQDDASASQKLIWPVVRGVEPALTVAVSVTAAPTATEVTGAPDEVIARVVEVEDGAVAPITCSNVVELSVPAVPVIVTMAGEKLAELLAVNVKTLEPAVAGFEEKLALTPLGNAVAVKFTLLLKPFTGSTYTVDVAVPPGSKLISLGAVVIVKFGVLMINEKVAEAVRFPEVPVIVIVEFPGRAALLTVNVIVLFSSKALPVAGFGENDAVTPLGRPDAARVTLPVNPYCGYT